MGSVFFLQLLSPLAGPDDDDIAFVSEPTALISGRTRVDAAVSIDDTFVEVDEDGIFQITVELEEGINYFEIVASVTGEQEAISLYVSYEPES